MLREQQGRQVYLAPQDLPEPQVSPVRQALRVLRVLPVLLGLLERQEYLDRQGLPEQLVFLGQRGRQEPRVYQVQQALRVQQVFQVRQGQPEQQVSPVLLALRGGLAIQGLREQRVRREQPETPEQLAILAPPVPGLMLLQHLSWQIF